jgi:hypothetical protein
MNRTPPNLTTPPTTTTTTSSSTTTNLNNFHHRRLFLHDSQLPSVPRMRATILLSAIEEFREAQQMLLESELAHLPEINEMIYTPDEDTDIQKMDEKDEHAHIHGHGSRNGENKNDDSNNNDAHSQQQQSFRRKQPQQSQQQNSSTSNNTNKNSNAHIWDQFKMKEDEIENIVQHLDSVCHHMDSINRQQQHRTDLHLQQHSQGSNINNLGAQRYDAI